MYSVKNYLDEEPVVLIKDAVSSDSSDSEISKETLASPVQEKTNLMPDYYQRQQQQMRLDCIKNRIMARMNNKDISYENLFDLDNQAAEYNLHLTELQGLPYAQLKTPLDLPRWTYLVQEFTSRLEETRLEIEILEDLLQKKKLAFHQTVKRKEDPPVGRPYKRRRH